MKDKKASKMRSFFYLLLVTFFLTKPSLAGPSEDLRDAENSYLYGDYARVLRKIVPVIEPDLLLSNPNKIARAYELAGLAAFFLDDQSAARRHFERLIRLRPTYVLDPVKLPPPVISFYDTLRDQLKEEIAKIQKALREHAEAEARRQRLANMIRVQRDIKINSRTVAALPLGMGQFQNGDQTLGQFFLVSELLSSIASMGFFVAVESMRTDSGRFRSSDIEQAKQFRTIQLSTAITALTLAVVGIIEAQFSFQPSMTLKEETTGGVSTVTPDGKIFFTF